MNLRSFSFRVGLVSICAASAVALAVVASLRYAQFTMMSTLDIYGKESAGYAAAVVSTRVKDILESEKSPIISKEVLARLNDKAIAAEGPYYVCIYDATLELVWQLTRRENITQPVYNLRGPKKIDDGDLNDRNELFCMNDSVNISMGGETLISKIYRDYKFGEEQDAVTLYQIIRWDEFAVPGSHPLNFRVHAAVSDETHMGNVNINSSHFSIVNVSPPKDLDDDWLTDSESPIWKWLISKRSPIWPCFLAIFLAFITAKSIRRISAPVKRLEERVVAGWRELVGGENGDDKKRGTIDKVEDLLRTFKDWDRDIRSAVYRKLVTINEKLVHDLRGVYAILHSGDRLSDEEKVSKLRSGMSKFHERMLTLSRDFVAAEETRVGPRRSDCLRVLEKVKSQYEDRLGEENRKIMIDTDPDRRAAIFVRMSPDTLTYVLENLMSNAREHGKDGDIHLSAKIMENKVRIIVEDEGPGIPTEQREEIFEWAKGKGSGKGLHMVKRDVERFDGMVEATEGKEGRGARIVLMLPSAT